MSIPRNLLISYSIMQMWLFQEFYKTSFIPSLSGKTITIKNILIKLRIYLSTFLSLSRFVFLLSCHDFDLSGVPSVSFCPVEIAQWALVFAPSCIKPNQSYTPTHTQIFRYGDLEWRVCVCVCMCVSLMSLYENRAKKSFYVITFLIPIIGT